MLTCEKALECMSEALDAPLPLEKQQELEDHLARCPECRAAYEALFQMEDALRGLGETSAPPELVPNVMAHIQAEKTQPRRPLSFWKQARWRSLAGLAACAVLCVGLYYGTGRSSIGSDVTVTPSETVQAGPDSSAPLPQAPEQEDSSAEGDTQSSQETPQTDATQDNTPAPAQSTAPAAPSGSAGTSVQDTPIEPEAGTRILPAQSEVPDSPSSESSAPGTASAEAQAEQPPLSDENTALGEAPLQENNSSQVQISQQEYTADSNLTTATALPPWGDVTSLVLQNLPEEAEALLPAQADWTQEEDGTRWCTVTPEELEALQAALAETGVETQLPEPPWTDLCAVVVFPAEIPLENQGNSPQSE